MNIPKLQTDLKPKKQGRLGTKRDETRWYPVEDKRYSYSGSAPIDYLNFTDWWEDGNEKGVYLHVAHKDGDTRHRVYPRYHRKGEEVRLGMAHGKLYWLT